MSAFYTGLAVALAYLLLSWPALRHPSRRYVLGAALLLVADRLAGLAALPRLLPFLPLVSGEDYWLNTLLALLVSLGALGLLSGLGGWPLAEFGLRLGSHPGTGRAVGRFLVPLLILETGLLWALVPSGHPSLNYQCLQISVGLTEELTFRGLLLALLDRAFPGRRPVLGAAMGWGAVVSSLLFGLCHGLRIGSDFQPTVHLLPMAIPTVGGFVLAWCRARSGNLLLPIAVHSGLNELVQLIALLKA